MNVQSREGESSISKKIKSTFGVRCAISPAPYNFLK